MPTTLSIAAKPCTHTASPTEPGPGGHGARLAPVDPIQLGDA
ncbi:hypothetical protein ACIPJM_22845 [Streptomyces halstedii]